MPGYYVEGGTHVQGGIAVPVRVAGDYTVHRLARSRCHPQVGQRFTAGGREYEFMGSLGDGAVGLVRKAQSLLDNKIVAVKLLAPDPKYIDIAAFDDVEQRFKREGLRGAHLRDENLVEIVAYEENADGCCFKGGVVKNPFIVMEYVRGSTLESFIKRMGGSSELGKTHVTAQTLSIARSVAQALRYLHEHKVIHRDVKPANIFLSTVDIHHIPTFVKLGDFGVTKWGDFLATAASGTLTVTKQQGLGTLKYMSPEQAVRPKDVTVRSDIFSFGISLFELFTGKILESPHHVFEIMMARNSRASIMGKLLALNVRPSFAEADIFELVLDMFLVGPKGRPTAATIAGRMASAIERA
jgi:serine/threonine-protein kinase